MTCKGKLRIVVLVCQLARQERMVDPDVSHKQYSIFESFILFTRANMEPSTA